MNNYIVTFEYRVMVTAFAILAMFISKNRYINRTWTGWQGRLSLNPLELQDGDGFLCP